MNKLGPHCIRATSAGAQWSRKANIVKQLDGTNILAIASPKAVRVFRKYFPYQDQQVSRGGGAIAQDIIAALGGYRHPRLYVEIFNEWRQRLPELESHVKLVADASRVLHEAGLQVAGFSFSTGNPEPEDWAYIQAMGFAGVDAIAIHEYWATQGFSSWNALRYRRVHQWLKGKHPPFLITECGRDAIKEEGAERRPGWKLQGVSAEAYVEELKAYDRELCQDDYVLGGVVFTSGPWADFAAFDTDELVKMIPAANSIQEVPAMALKEQFPEQFRQWDAAGGVENNFRKHLLGIGALKPTPDDLKFLAGEVQASAAQLKGALDRCPF